MAKKKRRKKSGPAQKQRATVYTMMLIFSFLALVLGCVLMYLEIEKYDGDIKAKEYHKSSSYQSLDVDTRFV